jgi:hypothetical protein
LVLVGVLASACGHAVHTGSAKNDWTTPTGYANATDPAYINPDAAAHRAKHFDFASREAPPLQSAPAGSAVTPPPNP